MVMLGIEKNSGNKVWHILNKKLNKALRVITQTYRNQHMGQRFMFVDISAFEDISSRFMAKVNTNLTSVLTILPQRH